MTCDNGNLNYYCYANGSLTKVTYPNTGTTSGAKSGICNVNGSAKSTINV